MSSNHSPANSSNADQRYNPLAGSQSQVESPRYRCPVASCQQVWYKPKATEQVPHCHIHDVQLIRDSKVH